MQKLLSNDSLLFELWIEATAVGNFKVFPLDRFFGSRILWNDILPVVLRRLDKYEFKSEWLSDNDLFEGNESKLSPPWRRFCLELFGEDESVV